MLKIAMLGAGSGFVLSVAKELIDQEIFADGEFVIMDPAADRLAAAEATVGELFKNAKTAPKLTAVSEYEPALTGANYVVTSCEKNRYANWVKDLRIPAKYGACQVKGENGGPGGLIHGMRNIAMFRNIAKDMEKFCPDAWLLNFTNPMSIICTWFKNYSPIKTLGFCHQVHGSFGLIAEQLGMQPGDLEVITGGVNHFNWLMDIRKKNTNHSCMAEFLQKVSDSKYWHQSFPNTPKQTFTLEILKTFGAYPVGYDDHIIEYLPFFYEPEEWAEHGFESLADTYEYMAANKQHTLETQRLLGKEFVKPPFPVDPDHPYYAENPCKVIHALETNTPTYFDAINIVNNGAIDNLPANAIVDVPALAVGGEVRSIHVGKLPTAPAELCRRQVTLHEMIAEAAETRSDSLAVQALCLDPYVRSITAARNIWAEFKEVYAGELDWQ